MAREGGQQHKTTRKSAEEEEAARVGAEPTCAERKEKLDDDVDAILDEIDEVLEANAEEFVRGVRPEGRPVSPMPDVAPARGLPDARQLVVRRLPRRAGTRPAARRGAPRQHRHGAVEAPHGTTIVAATFAGGVVMAGDRRATMGNIIAQRDIEKVFPADEYSCVGIAGSAGLAVEMVRLFQAELEHYEKIEGTTLSLDGKANRLAVADPRQPRRWPCRASPSCRCSPATTCTPARAGSSPTTSPAAATRSSVPLGRLGLAVRPRLAEEALPRRPRRAASARRPLSRRCTTPPTTTPPPAGPT